jgi:hypothetical protein
MTRIWVECRSRFTEHAFARVPYYSELGTQHLPIHVVSLGLRRGQPKIVMISTSMGMGVAPFPPGSPSGFLPLEKTLDVFKFFIIVQSLSFCLIGYQWFGQVALRSF